MTQFSSLYSARLDEELHSADSTVLFTSARRKAAINKGQEEFADLTECLLRQSTIAITGGTAEYDLNSTTVIAAGDFVRFAKEPVQFRYVDASSNLTVLQGDDLRRRDVGWLHRFQPGWQTSTVASTTEQLPDTYYLRADGPALYLGFTPTPSTGSSATATAIVPYLAQPAVLTSDTQEPFAVGAGYRTDLRPYHQALVHYAAHQLEKLRPDDQASDRQLQKFLGYVARYWQNVRIKGGTTLTPARQYFRVRETRAADPRR